LATSEARILGYNNKFSRLESNTNVRVPEPASVEDGGRESSENSKGRPFYR
jgi:hypothetical protein